MNDNKILITKELVIKHYKRSYFYRYFVEHLRMLFAVSVFSVMLWLAASHNVLNNPVAIFVLLIFLVGALLNVGYFITIIFEIVRVANGKFYITTDKVVERVKERYMIHIISIKLPIFTVTKFPVQLRFKDFGLYTLYRAYSSVKDKSVSANEQLDEAYLGDIYYVAVLNKSRTIVAAFDPDNYYLE